MNAAELPYMEHLLRIDCGDGYVAEQKRYTVEVRRVSDTQVRRVDVIRYNVTQTMPEGWSRWVAVADDREDVDRKIERDRQWRTMASEKRRARKAKEAE